MWKIPCQRYRGYTELTAVFCLSEKISGGNGTEKIQIDKEHMAKLALVGAIAENGRQVGRGLNNIAESNRDRMHYW